MNKKELEQLEQELNNIEDSVLKSRILLMNVLNVSKEYLLIHDNDKLDLKELLQIYEGKLEPVYPLNSKKRHLQKFQEP